MLANDCTLRNLIPDELAKGFGFFQSKPATAFSPFAVTPDELGAHWRGGRLHARVKTTYNGSASATATAGRRCTSVLRSDRARREDPAVHRGHDHRQRHGEQRRARARDQLPRRAPAIEIIETGKPLTPFMSVGDTIRIEMKDTGGGASIFGAIEQKVAALLPQR